LSGGVLSVRPPENVTFVAEENVLIGNTVLYGATAGRAFFRGLAGERFAVRNSGVDAVVEGVGDHGCEYMTGGRVVVLGPTGRNFAAGMSGGIAYVLDPDGRFPARCNTELVELEDCASEDLEKVRSMVEEHARRTDSPVAARVLDSWDELAASGAWVKVMPMDYKRALREEAERLDEEAGEPAVIGELGNGDGVGPVRAGQAAPYVPGGGHEEATRTGEAGQHEDAAVAAAKVGRATRARGAGEATEQQAEEAATEEVLPSNG
jgi:glutamate synthase (NADPH/NADH) large chain/glutamate synthase (ferredoxin)